MIRDLINDTIRSNKVDRDSVRDVDLHGRRFNNGGDSKEPGDFITRRELDNHLDKNKSKLNLFFTEFLSKARTFVISLIAPPVNSTEALVITKADQQTAVVEFDTLTSTPVVDFTSTIRTLSAASVAPPDGKGLEIRYSSGADTGSIVSIDRDSATIKPLVLNGSNFTITCTNLAFFGGTPVAKQTLDSYSTDDESVAYTGASLSVSTINYKDHSGSNASMNVVTGPASTFALVAELNLLRAAYENLRASYDDLRDKLQTTTLVG